MADQDRPRFYELTREESVALLERNHVGRLAFTFHDRVDVEPISYVFAEGWIFGRTAPGTKLTTLQHHPWVAFEIDEVRGRFDWQSVVAHGTLYFVEPGEGDRHHEAFSRALEILRAIDPEALTAGDTAPFRTTVFRIHVDELTGRGAAAR